MNKGFNSKTGFKNYIINGAFDVWQRGESFASNGYTADRWKVNSSGDAPTTSRSNITNTDADGVSYYRKKLLRITSGDDTTALDIRQIIEYGELSVLKEYTFSLAMKRQNDSNYRVSAISIRYYTSDGYEDEVILSQGFELSDILRTYSFTFSMPPYSGSASTIYGYDLITRFSGYASNSYVDLVNVQLEEGSYATEFEQRPYGLELSLCQRYYEFGGTSPIDKYNGIRINTGIIATGDQYRAQQYFSVPKRITPTVTLIDNDGTFGKIGLENGNGSVIANEVPDAVVIYEYGFTITHDLATPEASGIRCGWVADAEL